MAHTDYTVKMFRTTDVQIVNNVVYETYHTYCDCGENHIIQSITKSHNNNPPFADAITVSSCPNSEIRKLASTLSATHDDKYVVGFGDSEPIKHPSRIKRIIMTLFPFFNS